MAHGYRQWPSNTPGSMTKRGTTMTMQKAGSAESDAAGNSGDNPEVSEP